MKEVTLFWLVSMIVLFVLEAVTVNLVTLWFALGALGALITSIAGGELWLQIIVFLVVTVVTLIPTRKIAKKYFNKSSHQPTNADMIIGKDCVVIEEIDNLKSTGAVKHQGIVWTARSQDGTVIPENAVVTVIAIEGVKLIVAIK